MAIYEYHCPGCGRDFEFEHGMKEKPEVHCPDCGTVAKHVFVPSGMILKGSGFYNTDNRKPDPAAKADSDGESRNESAAAGKPEACKSCPAKEACSQ